MRLMLLLNEVMKLLWKRGSLGDLTFNEELILFE